jgi:hypothetical protein
MQYVVRGNLKTADDTKIKGVINRYRSLDKESLASHTDEAGKPSFTFEVKTKDLLKKIGMFAEFKSLVDEYTGEIDWHECRHDEGKNACNLSEVYRR